MTHDERCCMVRLLPTGEVAAWNLSESEAAAWARGYNEARASETRKAQAEHPRPRRMAASRSARPSLKAKSA